jgi:dihydroorotate dehydrogenase (NAD+) catalytic subunit
MQKYGLHFSTPLMNAAGSLGFAPDPYGPTKLEGLGAFVTNPVSLEPRSPAHGERVLSYPGGFLLHTGYPNPGLKNVIRRHAAGWSRSWLPVWVHLLPGTIEETGEMIRRLERVEGVAGVELGLPPEVDAEAARRFLQAAAGELTVVARVPFERAAELAEALTKPGEDGAAAISLAPPRGALPGLDGSPIHGRLYGPAVFPQALAAVQSITSRGAKVIAAGGVYRPQDVQAMLAAGAIAVQLDSVLWRGGFGLQVES